MENLIIYSSSPKFDGVITIDSSSKLSATKASRDKVSMCSVRLNKAGVYILFIKDAVYVGQSSSSIESRIFNVHSNSIEKDWQYVIAFTCDIDNNSLLFLENALCEYAHDYYNRCLTSAPAKENCNKKFRRSHYNLNIAQLEICSAFFKDILEYLASFNKFSRKIEIFKFKSETRDSSGTAEIEIHCDGKRKVILKRGGESKISKDVSANFASSQRVTQQRDNLISEGKIIDRILQLDVNFSSQSAAGKFLNGTSFDGNSNWKTDNGIRLKELL